MLRRSVLVMFCVLMVGPAWSALAGLDPSLMGWWAFDEGAGTVAADGSGNGNDGTVEGDAAWVPGVLETALQFNGSNSYVNAPHIPFDDRSFTIAMWINPGQTSSDHIFFSQTQSSSTDLNMHFRVIGGGTIRFGFYSNDLDASGETVEVGNWYHVALWYDFQNQNRRIYINGEMVAEAASTPYKGTTGDTHIGQWNGGEYFNGIIDDVQVYNRTLADGEVVKIMSGLADLSLAQNPSPLDEAIDIPRDVALAWEAGEFAATHDVYLGTAFDDVNDGVGTLVSQGQTATSLDPEGLLEYGQTYYWRVDEVNAAPDNTVFKGDVWSFSVERFTYPIAGVIATSNATSDAGNGPERTIDGSGLNENGQHSVESGDMWLGLPGADPVQLTYEFDQVYKLHEVLVWNYNVMFELILGFGLKDVTVEYSTDGVEWIVLGDVELAQATALGGYAANTTIAFDGVAAKYVRLTVNSGWGSMGQYGLSEVRFMSIPAQAREPQPADDATDVSVDTPLAWRAGREAVSHEVSFGTDPEALAPAGALEATSYDPGVLDLDTIYYWRVDEVNEADAISVWEGGVWNFTTQAYLIVDDFESYDDEDNAIYETWIDGWVNETGSTVGYLSAPFAETTIVNSGGQSMPLSYDNVGVATAEAELDLGQNWTASGIQSLSLYFYGDPGNSGSQLYIKIDGTKIVYDGSAVNITSATWNLWNIDLAASGASLSNVSSLTIGIEGAGATGIVYIDDIRLYPEILDYHKFPDVTAAGDTVVGVPNDGDWPDAETPDLAIDDDVNTKFLHRQGGAMATGIQVTPAAGATVVTGLTFTTANDVPTRDPITFELSGSNAGIDGPYELIAAGDIVDFAGEAEWPRFTKNSTVIAFDNDVAYAHYQIVFPTLRGESETLMQIAEIELIGETP
jgi:concanavalin A-like lectin/glucanase superfamily protein/F5/8 type C domain-containing protein